MRCFARTLIFKISREIWVREKEYPLKISTLFFLNRISAVMCCKFFDYLFFFAHRSITGGRGERKG